MTEQEEFEFRQRLEQEQAAQQASAAAGTATQVNPLYGVAGGAFAGQIAGPAINKATEAFQKNRAARVGASAPAAGKVPTSGLVPTPDQHTRIIQGGIDETGTTGRARQQGYNERTAAQSLERQAAEKNMQDLARRRIITGESPLTKIAAPTSTPSGIIVPGSAVYETPTPAPVAKPPSMVSKIGASLPQPIQKLGSAIGGVGQDLAAGIGGAAQAGVTPYIGRALAGAGLGFQGTDVYNRLQQGDIPGAAISGLGAAGSLAAFVPTPITRVGGTAVGVGAELLNQYLDRLKKQVEAMGQPQQPQPQQQPVPQMARGGLVHLKKGGQPELGEARAYEPSYSERIRDYAAKFMSPEQADRLFGGPRASLVDEFNPIGAALRAPGAIADAAKGFVKAGKEGDYLAGMGNYLVGAANVAPVIGPAARGAAKLGPKAAEMAENYLTKIGGIQNIVPPGQRPAYQIGASAPTKMSDFLQNHMGKYVVPTQADRMAGVGGPSYSANQLELPQYANRAWGSGNQGTATGITNLAKDPRFGGTENQIFAPLLGDPQMHISNQLAFDAVKDAFYKNQKNMTPEMRAKINEFMRSGGTSLGAKQKFDPIPGFEIADKGMIEDLGKSFQNRGLIGKHAFGGRDVGGTKAQIIPYNQMLLEMQDPTTLGAKTFSVGPRAFNLTGEVENVPRPDLNKAYPIQLMGKDYGVNFEPVPTELALMDFGRQWRKDTGNLAPKKSGEMPNPGYFEHTLGYKPRGSSERVYPRQQVTEELIKELQRSKFAEGGEVDGYQAGGLAGLGKRAHSQHAKVAQALEEYLKGNISQADRIKIVNEFLPIRKRGELPPEYTDEQIINALLANKQPKALAEVPAGMRVGNRLDIPAYTQHGVYVDTTHDLSKGNAPISYNRTGHLKDVEFSSKPNQAVRVGLGTKEQALTPMGAEMGAAKSPFALIKGTNVGTKDDEVRRMMAEMLNDPSYVQIGMDPRRGSQFFNKETGMPVFAAEEKFQSGPLVIVPRRGLEETSLDDPRLDLTDFPGKKYKKGGLATLKKKKK
jgi:hypothetical protein